jgi:hypothetical protein
MPSTNNRLRVPITAHRRTDKYYFGITRKWPAGPRQNLMIERRRGQVPAAVRVK